MLDALMFAAAALGAAQTGGAVLAFVVAAYAHIPVVGGLVQGYVEYIGPLGASRTENVLAGLVAFQLIVLPGSAIYGLRLICKAVRLLWTDFASQRRPATRS
ncbi:MAG: hypothetical protein CL858_04955 [Cupriavidus sp.]|uniref:hypothetical protein n=1 Tax=Cupriavidus pauculus TaxID=82633 RepID=UPI000C629CBB|nr:hypothetical protein [Cupriavidus pauculus]MBU64798.1 hypothetical protein [Cupriavidus sp.]